jgi:tight adherence protein B
MSLAPAFVALASGFLDSTGAVLLVSVVVAALIGLAIYALIGQHRNVGSRVGTFVAPYANPTPADRQATLVERALGDPRARQIGRSPFWKTLVVELDVAGIDINPQTLVLGTAIASVLVAWILATELSSPLGALLGLAVPFAAYAVVRYLADRQRRAFDEQLPDNLGVIAAAMRAGQTFVGALSTVVDDAPEPSRRELKRAVTDEQLGIPLDEALGHVTERMHSEDFQHVALVASLQRDTGGNTAEVIDLVQDTIRERLEIRRLVRALTAQGRLAGVVLSFLPIGLLVAISLINPDYIKPMFHDTIGVIMLVVSGIMVVVGGFVINKIIQIKV